MINGAKGEQLKMFMSPKELHSYVDGYGDFGGAPKGSDAFDTDPNTAEYKEANAERSGLADSINAAGVKKPLAISHEFGSRELSDGHHRMITQEAANPNRLMPIEHFDGWASVDTFRDMQGKDPTGDKPRNLMSNRAGGRG